MYVYIDFSYVCRFRNAPMFKPQGKHKAQAQYKLRGKSVGFDRLCCWFLFILNTVMKQEWNTFLSESIMKICGFPSVFYKLLILLLLYTIHNIYFSFKEKHEYYRHLWLTSNTRRKCDKIISWYRFSTKYWAYVLIDLVKCSFQTEKKIL